MVFSRHRLDSMGSSPGSGISHIDSGHLDRCDSLDTSGSCDSLGRSFSRLQSIQSSPNFFNHTTDPEECLEVDLDTVSVTVVDIPDGRIFVEGEEPRSRTVLRLEPFQGESTSFRIRLSTSHYAFSLKRSSTIRSISSFYSLCSILKSQHPYVSVSSLPVRPLIYLTSQLTQANQLASWLSSVLTDRQLLSNRALHLFLQTTLSMDRIMENVEGVRDDQVVRKLKSAESSPGFKSIFGRSYKGSRRTLEDQY